MKFKNYLNERQDLFITEDDIIDKIKENCKPYLNLLRKNKILPFIRNGNYDNLIGLKPVRKDRTPAGTNEDAFKALNAWLDKNGHARRDESIMSKSRSTPMFGEAHYIFPIGKFKFTQIRAQDFNNISSFYDPLTDLEFHTISLFLKWGKREKEALEILDRFIITNKGIKEAHYRHFEVWWECDKYYHIYAEDRYVINNKLAKLGLK